MTILIQTNKGKTKQNPYNHRITQGERLTVFGGANETAFLPAHSLLRPGFNFGTSFQAGPHGIVVVSLSGDPEDEAMRCVGDSAMEANIAWHVLASLTANEMKWTGMLVFTVARIHFNVANRCMICSL